MLEGVFYYGTYKDKENGNIITVTSTCSDGTVSFMDGDANLCKIDEKQFMADFEPAKINYREYSSQIVEACSIDRGLQKLAKAVIRRLDPDYFKVGSLVYFAEPSPFFEQDRNTYYREDGPENPFKIIRIDSSGDRMMQHNYSPERCLFLHLSRVGKNIEEDKYREANFILPIYIDKIVSNDAFWYLKRYDKAY